MSLHLAKLLSTRLRSGFIQRHRQTYRSRYPATDFIRGVTNLTKVTARKRLGLVFLFVILSQYDEGWNILDHTFECRSTTTTVKNVVEVNNLGRHRTLMQNDLNHF